MVLASYRTNSSLYVSFVTNSSLAAFFHGSSTCNFGLSTHTPMSTVSRVVTPRTACRCHGIEKTGATMQQLRHIDRTIQHHNSTLLVTFWSRNRPGIGHTSSFATLKLPFRYIDEASRADLFSKKRYMIMVSFISFLLLLISILWRRSRPGELLVWEACLSCKMGVAAWRVLSTCDITRCISFSYMGDG